MSLGRLRTALLALMVVARLTASGGTFIVNSANDASDGVCDTTHCSLREAILAANGASGADTIEFAIDSGVQTITVAAATFPAITDSVTIDGWSQPGFNAAAASPIIQLRASGATGNLLTISGNGQSTTIRGLAMNTCATAITVTGPLDSITIQGNVIGYDPAGTPTDLTGDGVRMTGPISSVIIGGATAPERNVIGMASDGIDLQLTSPSNILIEGNRLGFGNSVSGAPNVVGIRMASAGVGGVIRNNAIAGSSQVGLLIAAGAGAVLVEDNTIELNFNGAGMRVTDAPGTIIRGNTIRANTLVAVEVNSGGVTFGGSASGDGNTVADNSTHGLIVLGPGTGNVIDGNTFHDNGGHGVDVRGGPVTITGNVMTANSASGINVAATAAAGTVIRANRIGLNAAGSPVPNEGDGISIRSSGTIVGGIGVGQANGIAFNRGSGVAVIGAASVGNRIEGNSIYSSGRVGIDLTDGTTTGHSPNDPGDTDTHLGNGGQNFPVLDSALAAGNLLTVGGTLSSLPSRSYRVCVYGYDNVQHISHVQGRYFAGCTSVTTNSAGDGTFTLTGTIPSNAVYASATATSDSGDTSEFSVGIPIARVGTLSLAAASYSVPEGGTVAVSVSRSGGSTGAISATLSTSSGTASAGDFAAVTTVVTFGDQDTVAKTVLIPIATDSVYEGDETFIVTLSNPAGGTTIAPIHQATVTIHDDDPPPALSISDVGVTEGDEGVVEATFTVTRSGATERTVTVHFATANGTAVAPADYSPIGGVLTFTPAETTRTVTVNVNGDTIVEPDETFFVTLSSPTNATIAGAQGIGTIHDDDAVPALSASDVTVVEGTGGTTDAIFTLTLSSPSAQTITVDYSTSDVTATAGSDYIATSGVVTFAPHAVSQTIRVLILGDTTHEPDESFLLTLTNPVNVTLSDTHLTAVIEDDDPQPQISIADVSVIEGNGGPTTAVQVPVTLSHASSEAVTVRYATEDDTAFAGVDYESATGTVTFAPGETSSTIEIRIVGDLFAEPVESLRITLSEPTGATILDSTGVVTIIDDDGTPAASINDVTVVEGDDGIVDALFTVTLSVASAEHIALDYATADQSATAGTDYLAASGTLTFDPGAISKTIVVQVLGDTVVEPNETFVVDLTSSGLAHIADGQGMATIVDDDSKPVLSLTGAAAIEGNSGTSDLLFAATLSAPSARTITVEYATADGSATAGDYITTRGTLTFAPNVTSQTIAVPIVGDTIDEPDETFLLNLSNPTNVLLAESLATGRITDDDPTPLIAIADSSVVETNGGTSIMHFPVTLSNASSQPVQMTWSTVDGTAVAGTDYVAQIGQVLTIAPGALSASIAVEVIGDTIAEPNETFTVQLAGASNATFADDRAEGTIFDDDGVPQLILRDLTVAEGNDGTSEARLEVVLSHASSESVLVHFATEDGTATAGADYESSAGVLTFAAGETAKDIPVRIVGDRVPEPIEFLVVTLLDPAGATIADSQAVLTIIDDDGGAISTPSLFVLDTAVVEGHSGTVPASFVVFLSGSSSEPVTVGYSTADGTARAGSDYTARSGTLTFTPGTTFVNVTVPVLGDRSVEPTETFRLRLENPVNATIAVGSATGTIVNDDVADPPPPAPIPISRIALDPSVSIAECTGGTGVDALFTIRVQPVSSVPITLRYATNDGTARAGADYEAVQDAVTLRPGQSSATIAVRVLCDSIDETDETFFLLLEDASSGNISGPIATAVILDDDEPQQRTRAIAAVVGATRGMHGSFFRTELRLLNPTELPIRGRIVLHPAGRPARTEDPAVSYALQPNESLLFADIMGEAGLEGLASADFIADAGEVPVVYVRVFNDAGEDGTSGFVEEELAPEDALHAGERGVLFVPVDLSAQRFNIGVRSLDEGASFDVAVHDGRGPLRSRVTRSLPPNTFVQMSGNELAGIPLRDADVITISVSAGRLIAYGAMTDNITNDPSVQFARKVR